MHKGMGIILKKSIARDKDQIIVVFSQEYGKQYLIAKGAKKITSRRMMALDTLNIISFQYIQRSQYRYLRTVDLISRLQKIKNTIGKTNALLLILDIVDRIVPLHQPEPAVFQRLLRYLRTLSKGMNISQAAYSCAYDILAILGYIDVNNKYTIFDILALVENISEREFIAKWQLMDVFHA